MNRNFLLALLVASLAGCATPVGQKGKGALRDTLNEPVATAEPVAVQAPPRVEAAKETPRPAKRAPEVRFNLSVNNARASEVFVGMVSGTPYSMLVHPDVSGVLTLNLKDTTVPEAMEAIRRLYGYEYEIQGTRIIVPSPTAQTRIYTINALAVQRRGMSDTRVVSGSVSLSEVSGSGGGSGPASASRSLETSSVQTLTDTKFWDEIATSLKALVGEGGNVVVSPQSGMVIVKAAPAQLALVEKFLRASELIGARQVMLEAKIIEVELSEGYQSGVNWARLAGPQISQGAALGSLGLDRSETGSVGALLGGNVPAALTPDKGLFSLAFNDGDFAAVINLIESQGAVHVLSSPRIATTNNQKAVLRVGTDDYFVTEVTGGTPGALGVAPTPPTVTVRPFFSGIALDVTPQIDDKDIVTLHVRPSISTVKENKKIINLGSAFGDFVLPLASSSISETDSVVRLKDGQIVAIGGLMRQSFDDSQNRLPVLGKIPVLGELFGHTQQSQAKRELVVLIRTTLIREDRDWRHEQSETLQRLERFATP